MAPPNWLKNVAWVALLWNLLAVIAFVMQVSMTKKMIYKLPLKRQVA